MPYAAEGRSQPDPPPLVLRDIIEESRQVQWIEHRGKSGRA